MSGLTSVDYLIIVEVIVILGLIIVPNLMRVLGG